MIQQSEGVLDEEKMFGYLSQLGLSRDHLLPVQTIADKGDAREASGFEAAARKRPTMTCGAAAGALRIAATSRRPMRSGTRSLASESLPAHTTASLTGTADRPFVLAEKFREALAGGRAGFRAHESLF